MRAARGPGAGAPGSVPARPRSLRRGLGLPLPALAPARARQPSSRAEGPAQARRAPRRGGRLGLARLRVTPPGRWPRTPPLARCAPAAREARSARGDWAPQPRAPRNPASACPPRRPSSTRARTRTRRCAACC